MYRYDLTFTLSINAPGASYQERYEGLMQRITSECAHAWTRPTSFVSIESTMQPTALVQYLAVGLDASHDFLLAMNKTQGGAYFGSPGDMATFRKYHPFVIAVEPVAMGSLLGSLLDPKPNLNYGMSLGNLSRQADRRS